MLAGKLVSNECRLYAFNLRVGDAVADSTTPVTCTVKSACAASRASNRTPAHNSSVVAPPPNYAPGMIRYWVDGVPSEVHHWQVREMYVQTVG